VGQGKITGDRKETPGKKILSYILKVIFKTKTHGLLPHYRISGLLGKGLHIV
jgi:hypothetical protein